jgi:CarboxypepD_reg-like domain
MAKLLLTNFIKTFLFVIFCGLNFKVYAQEKSVYGNVKDPKTNKAIASINITNTRSKQIVVTNETGDFYMRAMAGDSILISSFGYERKGIKWNGIDKQPILYAKQQAIMLQEVLVVDKSYQNLQKEIEYFLNNPYHSKAIRNEIIKNLMSANTSRQGIGISIDGLYDLYSKQGKNKQKLADMQFNDAKQFYADLRYNQQVVSQITHLPADDLEDFMGFCKPTQDFILHATDYELTFKILKCLNDFRSTRVFRRLR